MSDAVISRIDGLINLAKRHELKLRYIIVGGFNTLFGIAFFFVLRYLDPQFSKHYFLWLIFAQLVCTTVAYFLYKFLVFRTSGDYVRELIAFFSSYYVNYAINWAVLPICVELFGIDPLVVQTVFILAMVVVGFFWNSTITFRQSPHIKSAQ